VGSNLQPPPEDTAMIRPALLLASLHCATAFGAACYVSEETSGTLPDPVTPAKCFYFEGMDDVEAMQWACRDKTDVGLTGRQQHQSCPQGAMARCTAPMTPETLANEQAFGERNPGDALPATLPDGARIVTLYYQVTDREQAKLDCEKTGGRWE